MMIYSPILELLSPSQIEKAFERVNIEIRDPLNETIMVYKDVLLVRDGDILKINEIMVATPTVIAIAASFVVRSIADHKCWATGNVGTAGADFNFNSIALSPAWPVAVKTFEIDMSDAFCVDIDQGAI